MVVLNMPKCLHRLGIVILVASALATPLAAAEPTPVAAVEALHEVVFNVMKQPGTFRDRIARLTPRIMEICDFRRISAAVASESWAAAAEPARVAFAKALMDFTVIAYAERFTAYESEQFKISGTRKGPRDLHLVDTRISLAGGAPVAISYALYRDGNRWRIVDVLWLSMFSEIAVRRSEFAAELVRSGLPGMTQILKSRTAAQLAAY